MELSKKLANKYFSNSDAHYLNGEITKKLRDSEEYKSLSELISKAATKILLETYPDKEALELSKKYPRIFKTSSNVQVYLSSLGITTDKGNYYTEDNQVSLPGYITVNINESFPSNSSSIEITPSMLAKLPNGELELLREWVSRFMHLSWITEKERRDFYDQSYSIKTFGKLYRTNKDWYELIVKARYMDEATDDPSEAKEVDKEENKNKFIASLNNLKTILEL